jgi:hypothetical protein
MSARPWIRAASTGGGQWNGGAPTDSGPRIRGGAPVGGGGPRTGGGGPAIGGGGPAIGGGGPAIGGGAPMGGGPRLEAGHASGRNFPGHASSSPPSSAPPRIYNPPRPFVPAAGSVYGSGPRAFGPATHGNAQSFASTGPRITEVAPAGNPPRASSTPVTYGTPHNLGVQADRNPARVYNPPPRTFETPPAVNPTRSFGSSSAGVYNPPARTFAPPQRSFSPPAQPPRQTFAAPQMNAAPQRSFSAPAAGGFGNGGGGMHVGGGHRR